MIRIGLVTFVLALHIHRVPAQVNVCSNVANGVFLANLTDCSKYIICWNETAHPGSCPEGLFFNRKFQRCDFSEAADCAPQCSSSLVSFAYDKTCTKYVLCFNSTPVVQECLDDLQYNANTDRCDHAKNVDCQEHMCAANNDPNNIIFLPSHANCSKYYICHDGIAVAKTCSDGLYFNPAKQGCDYKSNVKCSISTEARPVLPYSKLPPARANISCPKRGSHFYPNNKDKTSYYFCLNGNGIILTCSPGLVYDKVTQSCRDEDKVEF